MTIEQKLLIALLGNTSENEIKLLLQESVDWKVFLATAENHRVIPLVFQRLRGFSAELPPEVLADLQIRAEGCATQNLTFDSELLKIAKLFQANEIEFLFYKGALLALLAYGDSSLRQFGDLDVLIRKKDFPKIEKLLLENGGKSAWNLSDKQKKPC